METANASVRTRKVSRKRKRRQPKKERTFLVAGSDPWLTTTSLILMGFGMVMIVSTQLGKLVGATQAIYSVIFSQVIYLMISLMAMMMASRLFRYQWAARTEGFLIALYTMLLIGVVLFGVDNYGSRAWLSIGPLSVQPSEFGKPLLIIVLACAPWLAERSKARRKSFWTYFQAPLVLMGLSSFFLIFFQKDFGSWVITMGIGVVGILIPKGKELTNVQRWIVRALVLFLVLFVLAVTFSEPTVAFLRKIPGMSHIAIRIENMHDPYLNIHDTGYQPANALYGIADAGLFGRGLGSSVRKYGFLTQAESDYILAVIIEETGIIGFGLVIVGYGILLWRLVHWALRASGCADRVLLMGVATYLALHFFVNVGGVSGLIPMTGVPLLFISAGGSSILAVCIAIGLAQNRIADIVKKEGTGEKG